MKCSLISTLACAEFLAAAASSTTCHADDCARAVTGTYQGLTTQSARSTDCASFFLTALVPKEKTVKITETVWPYTETYTTVVDETVTKTIATETAIETKFVKETTSTTTTTFSTIITQSPDFPSEYRNLIDRNPDYTLIIPTALPSYAQNACAGTSKYSSACSCLGVTPAYELKATPTITTTVKITSTHRVSKHVKSTALSTIITTNLINLTTTKTLTSTSKTTISASCTPKPINGFPTASIPIALGSGSTAKYSGQAFSEGTLCEGVTYHFEKKGITVNSTKNEVVCTLGKVWSQSGTYDFEGIPRSARERVFWDVDCSNNMKGDYAQGTVMWEGFSAAPV